jgi:hypothetical protein
MESSILRPIFPKRYAQCADGLFFFFGGEGLFLPFFGSAMAVVLVVVLMDDGVIAGATSASSKQSRNVSYDEIMVFACWRHWILPLYCMAVAQAVGAVVQWCSAAAVREERKEGVFDFANFLDCVAAGGVESGLNEQRGPERTLMR